MSLPKSGSWGRVNASVLTQPEVADTTLRVLMPTNELFWYVAHTRRAGKRNWPKYCEREGSSSRCMLPARSINIGQNGHVPEAALSRLCIPPTADSPAAKVYQSDFVANLLDVPDQESFARAVGRHPAGAGQRPRGSSGAAITAGSRSKSNPARCAGWKAGCKKRAGVTMVLLRLDFISQAAAVKLKQRNWS